MSVIHSIQGNSVHFVHTGRRFIVSGIWQTFEPNNPGSIYMPCNLKRYSCGVRISSVPKTGITSQVVLTGINEPLADIDDNSGVMNGTISEDGMSYTGTWIEKGGYTFVMAEDGLSINATISKSLESDAVVEQMTFSK
jgi:hypothetical protein